MARLDGWFDAELQELFRDDPSLMETAHLLHDSRPEAPADPGFQRRLRTELMVEARRSLAPRPRRRFALRLGFGQLALGGAAVGIAAVAATVFALVGRPLQDHQTIEAYSNVAAQHAVSPDDVITVSFNQPMDEQAVVQGLSIRPATQVTTSWQGNNLLITPTHHLAGNTPYTVTIPQNALRTSSGAVAAAPVEIAFGTAPTPTPNPQTPTLSPSVVGPAGSQSSLLYAPDGGIVATNAAPASGNGDVPAGTPAPTSGAATSATAGPAAGVMEEFSLSGGPVQALGPASTAAAFSPNGSTLAYVTGDGGSGSDLVVSNADGSRPHTLTDSATPIEAITWTTNDALAYDTATTLKHIDLSGRAGTTVHLPSGYSRFATLAPGGGYAFITASNGPGALLDLSTGGLTSLRGSQSLVAFSADGSTVAWVDSGSATPVLWTVPTAGGTPARVATLMPGSPIAGIALSGDGATIAYVQGPSGSQQLVVARVSDGTPLAVGPAPSALAFSPQGGAIAMLLTTSYGTQVEQASLPGVHGLLPASLPPAAVSTLNGFVTAQVAGDQAALQQLSAPSTNAAGVTPSGLSRAYQIFSVARPDGTVDANVELIVDPSATQTAPLVADERLTLSADPDGQYVVSSLHITSLHAESTGPHVISVSASPQPGGTALISVTVDSDLNPSTVAGAVSVSANGQPVNVGSVQYNANSRTLTISVTPGSASLLTVTLSPSLQDVDGNALASTFTGSVAV